MVLNKVLENITIKIVTLIMKVTGFVMPKKVKVLSNLLKENLLAIGAMIRRKDQVNYNSIMGRFLKGNGSMTNLSQVLLHTVIRIVMRDRLAII